MTYATMTVKRDVMGFPPGGIHISPTDDTIVGYIPYLHFYTDTHIHTQIHTCIHRHTQAPRETPRHTEDQVDTKRHHPETHRATENLRHREHETHKHRETETQRHSDTST